MNEFENTGVLLASNCATATALKDKKPDGARKLFKETTERFLKQYPIKEHQRWFMSRTKMGSARSVEELDTPHEDFVAYSNHIYELEALLFTAKESANLEASRPVMIVYEDFPTLRHRLEDMRRDYSRFQNQLTSADRALIGKSESWKVGAYLH